MTEPETPIASAEAPPETAPAAPPSIADGVERHLDPRAVNLQQIVGWIVAAVICLPSLIALIPVLIFAPLLGWVKALIALGWCAVAAGLSWLAWRWPAIEHRHTSYRVDSQGIEIRRGVFWRRVINVPRSRVQHTDVAQGPLERSRGLGTLSIYTAGTDYAKVDLSGLAHETALEIRNHLLPRESADAV